jgi:hypothetical protein
MRTARDVQADGPPNTSRQKHLANRIETKMLKNAQ